ncbi:MULTISPECIES: hypothetical protein [Roseobacteraceae]|uniref:Uncharacterized protein n=2 Tax=Roseobacteraceae TaxID=2854170 RepID=A0A1H8LTH4_9RHOB|nr:MULTISPECIES: hypothetical protein [Roseobacteraceae]MDT0684033.1 hypothetical protein [Roseicyclus sp. F158]SEO08350.1 hypothetical protein SAMN04488011_11184 [Palleronia pelagia]
MFIGSLVSLLGLGILLWLLFTLAIHALPFFVGLTVGMYANESGAGLAEALGAGFFAGIGALVLGQLLIAILRNPWLQAGVALVYALPAALSGYYAVHGLSGIGFDAEFFRVVLGGLGGLIIGGTAWVRMGNLFGTGPDPIDGEEATILPR